MALGFLGRLYRKLSNRYRPLHLVPRNEPRCPVGLENGKIEEGDGPS